jgi:dienelactone hydrolase
VEKRLDAVADLAAAATWLQRQPDIAGDRLAVYGGSYGGFMVLAALTTYPALWAAGVDIVGISNMVTFLENTSAYRRAHREAEYGSLARDREFLAQISPLSHVDQITAPLIVIHGANDPRVPLSEAEQIVAALEARNVPVELLVFPDEGHGLVRLKNKEVAYPAVAAFLERHGVAPAAERRGEPMKARLVELVEEEYSALQETLAQVPRERMTEPGVVGSWTVKDILAHIAAWQGRMARWVSDTLRGAVPQVLPAGMTWDDLDRWNEQTYLENRDRPLAEVLDEFARSYDQALEATRAATEDDLFDPARFPWREGRPLWVMVAANTFWHHAEHAQAIGQWLRGDREGSQSPGP